MLAVKCLVLSLLTTINNQLALAAFPIRIVDFQCQPNDEYCSSVDCSFDTIRSRIQVLSFSVEIAKPLKSVLLDFQLYKQTANHTYEPFLLHSTENLCKYLSSTERANIVGRFMSSLRQYGRLPEKCPVEGAVYMQHYPLDLSFYPSTVPTGNYKLLIQITADPPTKGRILNATINFAMQR